MNSLAGPSDIKQGEPRRVARFGRADGDRAFRAAVRHSRHVRFLRMAVPAAVAVTVIAGTAFTLLLKPLGALSGAPTRYATVVVDVDGSLSWGSEVELVVPPDGDALDATWTSASGDIAVDATLLPVSHVDGGILYVPVPDTRVTAITIPGYGTLAAR